MTRGLLIALIGGLASATFFLAIRTGAPGAIALTYLASVPILAVGLSQGLVNAAIATIIAGISIMLGIHATAAGIYIAIAALPALIVIRQSLFSRPGPQPEDLEWYPIGMVLGWLTAYGLVALAIISIYFLGDEGGITGKSQRLLAAVFSKVTAANPQITIPIEGIARYLPGMFLSVWLLISIVNATLAQNVLARIGHAIRPLPSYSSLNLPIWMGLALAIVILMSFFSGVIGDFGRNASPLLSTPFFLLGLAVIHTLSRRVSARGPVLFGVYFLLVIVGWLSALVVLLGVLEQWISLRERFAAPDEDQENE
ncbi:MAG: DUF2232 domain-containing protein [Alphaproteobacteria bacterium]